MRILYVCADRGIPLCGAKGASVHVRSITAALGRIGHTVTLAVAKLGAGNPPPGVHRLEILREDPREAADQLVALIAQEGVECVIERYSLQSGAARTAADVHGVRLLLEVNAPLVNEATRYRGLINPGAALERERQVFASADAIQVVSARLMTYVRSVAPDAHVHLLPNGVEFARFASAAPAELAQADGRVLVGFIGSMKAWHGVIDLLEAFARVAGRPEQPMLLLVGHGPDEEAARRRAQAPDLNGRVLLTGSVAHAAVPSLIRRLDIAVAPYIDSGDFYFSPLKIMEYLAAGRPVIYPNLGELEGLVGDAGLVYPAGDVTALADRLQQLIANAGLRARLGVCASWRAQPHAWEHVAEELVVLTTTTRNTTLPAPPAPHQDPRQSALAR